LVQNAYMTDVPLSVAAVTAAAGVGGAAIPSIATIIRDVRQAGRDRRDRQAELKRQACLDLLRSASELRARVANTADYHGAEIGARMAQIRESEAAIHLYAAGVALLAPSTLAEPAAHVAGAASRLVESAEAQVNTTAMQMVSRPDSADLDSSVTAFQHSAINDARARRAKRRSRSAPTESEQPGVGGVEAQDQ
jgi:hypothetical protein